MRIAVYCASSTKIHPDYAAAATELGSEMARRGIGLINGAGNMGLMAATSNGALAHGGEVTGVIPRFMVDNQWHHEHLTHLIVTKDMHERKQTIATMSDACIALPGGCGTLEELMEVITWKQLGLYLKPIVILNLRGYYDPLLQQLQRGIDEHFMRALHARLWCVATTPTEAIDLAVATPMWDPAFSKSAAI